MMIDSNVVFLIMADLALLGMGLFFVSWGCLRVMKCARELQSRNAELTIELMRLSAVVRRGEH
jgi:hypothetical protein